jgi:ribosome-associated protein
LTSRQLAIRIARICDEKKAEKIVILDVRKLTFLTDFFIVASSRHERQSSAIAGEIRKTMKSIDIRELGQEARKASKWVLQDFGDVVIHIFKSDQREFYDIESLWVDAPQIKWELARRKSRAVKKA